MFSFAVLSEQARLEDNLSFCSVLGVVLASFFDLVETKSLVDFGIHVSFVKLNTFAHHSHQCFWSLSGESMSKEESFNFLISTHEIDRINI